MALLTYSFAFFTLPKEMQKATALVPALQSNWLMMHISIMILSYAVTDRGFGAGFGLQAATASLQQACRSLIFPS